jgi:hypothetical protein
MSSAPFKETRMRLLHGLMIALLATPAIAPAQLLKNKKADPRDDRPPAAFFVDSWRPDPTVVVATLDGQPIDEAELFAHLLIEQKDPMILKNWQTASARRAPAQHQALRDAILSRARIRLAAQKALDDEQPPSPEVIERGARMRAYPTATMLYADLIARPSVEIDAVDVAQAYESNPARFRKPDAFIVRELRVPINQPGTDTERLEARSRAQALHEAAMSGGGLTPLLQENPQLRILQDPEATQRFEAGSSIAPPLVFEQLSRMSEGQVSHPVPTSSAFSLFELVRVERGQTTSVREAEAQLREELRQSTLKVRTDSLLEELIRERYPLVYRDVFPFAEDESTIIRIGEFDLKYAEMMAAYPDIPTEPLPTQEKYDVPEGVGDFLKDLRDGELLTQELERVRALDEPRYQAALRAGRDRVLAEIQRTRELAEQEPTDAEVLEWIELNRDRLAPASRQGVWQLSIIPEGWADLPQESQRALEGEMRGVLSDVIKTSELLLDERELISGPRVLRDPNAIVGRLLRNDPGRYRMELLLLGQKTEQEAQTDLGLELSELTVGEFSEIDPRRDGVFAAVYVGGEVEQVVPLDEQLIEQARKEMLRERVIAPLEEELAQLESEGRLRMLLPEDQE